MKMTHENKKSIVLKCIKTNIFPIGIPLMYLFQVLGGLKWVRGGQVSCEMLKSTSYTYHIGLWTRSTRL